MRGVGRVHVAKRRTSTLRYRFNRFGHDAFHPTCQASVLIFAVRPTTDRAAQIFASDETGLVYHGVGGLECLVSHSGRMLAFAFVQLLASQVVLLYLVPLVGLGLGDGCKLVAFLVLDLEGLST